MQESKRNRAAVYDTVVNGIAAFLHLFIAMYISELLVETPAFGGALFVAGLFWIVFLRFYSKRSSSRLPATIRAKGVLIFVVSLLLNAALVFIYPVVMSRPQSWVLFFSVGLMLARQGATEAIARSCKPGRTLRLVAVHLLFLLGGAGVFLGGWDSPEMRVVFICLSVTALPLIARQTALVPRRATPEDFAEEQPTSDDFMQVESYRIYNRMVVNVLVAVNLSIATYVFYLRYMPYTGFLSSFAGLLGWLVYTFAVTGFFVFLLRRRTRRYEKTTLFFVGVVLWVAPTILVYRGTLSLGGPISYLVWAVLGFALACMLSIIVALGAEMRSVIELGLGKVEDRIYTCNTRVMVDWATLVSLLLLLSMFTLASFIMDGRLGQLDDALPVLPDVLQLLFLLAPLVCVVSALGYLVLQPLDRRYAAKLRAYRAGLKEGELNPPMAQRLKKVLVASYPRRVGIRIVKGLVRPFVRLRVVGRDKVRAQELPVVFICNHYELFGPLAAVLCLPYYFRPWIIHDAVDKALIAAKLTDRIAEMAPWMPKKLPGRLGRVVAPAANWIVESQEPITVYRDGHRGIVDTINQTIDALESEDNVLIFPEDRSRGEDGKFALEGVGEFFTGFSSIGRVYYKKTGRRLAFVPVFISKKKRTLTFGDAVVFDPKHPKMQEKDRIVNTLHDRMTMMSQ